mmetsp:Transcript_36025/g.52577  ORF Transcript_36025/g.52577 Transcript_36025/m.52577 type:complete len:455 (+) Transcript_36025:454-1818(+)
MIRITHAVLLFVAVVVAASDVIDDTFEDPSVTITGDIAVWDAIFSSRTAPITIISASSHNLIWTEGPTLVGKELFFSDTVDAKIYALDVSSLGEEIGTNEKNERLRLRVVKERSGDNPPEDDSWRAKPGSNGLFLLPPVPSPTKDNPNNLLVCQHGARRIAVLDITASSSENKLEERDEAVIKMAIPLTSEWNGRRLNGPNDIAVRQEDGKMYAYFTDPVYAWLEKDRFEELPYLDERVKSKYGAGHCGVYRFELSWNGTTWNRVGNVELLQVMERPNGIGFFGSDGDDSSNGKLIVSECCQGSHLKSCTQGTSRWIIFQQNNQGDWVKDTVIENVFQTEEKQLHGRGGGCADGFALYHYANDMTVGGNENKKKQEEKKAVLISSCSDGLCIVDLQQNRVVARLWTFKKSGCKVSNVAIGNGWAFLTGNCGVLGLALRDHDELYEIQSSYRAEL